MANREMKKSGIDWIGEIPKNWNVVRLGRIGKFSASGIDKKINKNEEVVKIVNYVDVYRNNKMIIDDDIDFMEVTTTAKRKEQNLLEKGDMVFTPSSETIEEIGRSAVVYETIDNLSFSYHVLRFHPNVQLDLSFKKYMANNHFLYNHFSSRAVGTVRKTLNRNDFNAAPVIIPPLEEQQKIAAFLDEKVAHIDNIIEDTKKSIENLKAYKQSLITERITKGMDPNVDMKDSGVKYIGKIPSHWKFSKFKYLLNSPLKYGANESGVAYDDNKPRYIRITDILEGNKLINSNRQSLDEDIAEEYILKDGDLLFARSGATAGKTYMVTKKTPRSAFAGYLIKGDVGDVYVSNYVYYYTLSKSYEEWKNSVVIQATIQNIGAEKYANMFLPIPPKDEQIDIVEYLNKNVESIDLILEDKKLLLSEFESYKRSLIYEYVTGKKEVK